MTAAGNVQSIGQAAGASPDQQGSLGGWQEADQGANSDGWFMGLVGHGMREDIRQLHAAGVKLPPAGPGEFSGLWCGCAGLVQVDTQALLHAVLGCRSQAQMSLASLLRWLQVECPGCVDSTMQATMQGDHAGPQLLQSALSCLLSMRWRCAHAG
ncbi:hypothetical protein QJQ45_026805 [Haematococcus lacustris]|nr:hypothetical protein QJQ45_026805 [Haematococcus lacustris]